MAAGDAIRDLTRYHAGWHKDPRENRPTAAVTALLKQSPALATRVAQEWIGEGALAGPVQVKMQRAVGGRVGWIDLELVVKAPRRKIIWIEAKVGHRLSGENQLAKYISRLRTFDVGADERLVLLLAPAQRRSAFADIPLLGERSDTSLRKYFVSWQDLYAILDRGVPKGSEGVRIRWLLREVLGYMESEKLQASELKPQHFTALRYSEDAFGALERVLGRAEVTLSKQPRWKTAAIASKLKDGYWEQKYRPVEIGTQASRPTRARLAWGVEGAELFAGVYFDTNAGGEIRPLADDRWRAALEAGVSQEREWDVDDPGASQIWVGESTAIRNVVRAKTVEGQADEVAQFVGNAFSRILRAWPATPTRRSRRSER